MEAHAENSSDKNNPNTQSESLLSLKNFLFVTTRGSIKWVGNIDSLERFMDDLLNTETKWQSRGGYKLYESPSLVIRWYTATKSLTFNGSNGEDLKIKITEIIEDSAEEPVSDESEVRNAIEDTSPRGNMAVEESIDNCLNLTSQNTTSMFCETEPDKNVAERLKMVESQMNQKIEALAYEIQKLKGNDMNTLHIEFVHTGNAQLKKENEALMERVQNLGYIMSDRNTKVKDLENEKMSLITVINILQNEHSRDDKPCEKRNEGKQCKTNSWKKPDNVSVLYVDETENYRHTIDLIS